MPLVYIFKMQMPDCNKNNYSCRLWARTVREQYDRLWARTVREQYDRLWALTVREQYDMLWALTVREQYDRLWALSLVVLRIQLETSGIVLIDSDEAS